MFRVKLDKLSCLINKRCLLIEIQKTYASEMRRFGSLIGADVSSRLKLSLSRTQSKEDGTGGMFGDI